jgi:Cysteine-rich CPXCG
MEIESGFVCQYCFSENAILVDGSGDLEQRYVEDCQVCCRPNALTIVIGEDRQSAVVSAEPL